MIGMLIFPKSIISHSPSIPNDTNSSMDEPEYLDNNRSRDNFSEKEGTKYFKTVEDSLMSLLVYLTTANNPDVMTTIYQYNRLSFIYFFLFLSIGLYLILNLLTAAVYSEFRGFMEQSMQSSFVRRRVAYRAAFAVLAHGTREQCASKDLVRQLLQKANVPKSQLPSMYHLLETVNTMSDSTTWEEFRNIFDLISKGTRKDNDSDVQFYSRNVIMSFLQKLIRHNFFQYFTICATVIHVLALTVEMEIDYINVMEHSNSPLSYINFIFFFYYIFEQSLKLIGLGFKVYFKSFANIFEGLVTAAIVITEIILLAGYGHPFHQLYQSEPSGYSVLIRLMNLFIVFRLLRIIPQFTSVSFVFGTMIEILKNLRAFAGVIIVIYYLFALLGMLIFGGNTNLEESVRANSCGSYENLQYYSYNFHDFAASLVLLWNIMVVNNWYVFLDAFTFATDKWSQLYFIAWWLVSVIITVNVFISLVIEVFLKRWEVYHEYRKRQSSEDDLNYRSGSDTSLGESYNGSSTFATSDIRIVLQRNLTEPAESELQHELHKHTELL